MQKHAARLLFLAFAALPSATIFSQIAQPEPVMENPAPPEGKAAEKAAAAPADGADLVHDFVEKPPSFPGGEAALMKYLGENLKYPALARENAIQGRVILSFVVRKDGQVTDVRVLKDIGAGCGKEALRVVSAMPKWTPGQQGGKPVSVKYTLPISFKLESDAPATALTQPAVFPGGDAAMQQFFQANAHYPKKARKKKVEGAVRVSAVIDPSGRPTFLRVVHNLGYGLDEEAIRLVQSMPSWQPARRNNAATAEQVEILVVFKLPK